MLIAGPSLKREPRVIIDYCFHFGSRGSQSICLSHSWPGKLPP
jgi:hypothetical protein